MPDPTLVAILAELRAIRHAIETKRGAPDHRAVELLRAIRTSVGCRLFTSIELSRHAALPLAADLRGAIEATVGDTNPKRIGKWLRSLEGVDVDGMTIERTGSDRLGAIWRLRE